jgi:hypothetical protein
MIVETIQAEGSGRVPEGTTGVSSTSTTTAAATDLNTESLKASTPSIATATATAGNSGSRARTLKEKFIEVYAGSQCFSEVDLNVAILIHLLASERLYEVVVINKESAEEIDRLYVYEDEIIHQMNGRRIALSAACDSHKAAAAVLAQKVNRRGSVVGTSSLSTFVRDRKAGPIGGLTVSQSSSALVSDKRRSSLDELLSMTRRKSFNEREKVKKEALAGFQRKTVATIETRRNSIVERRLNKKTRRISENAIKDEEIVKFISHNALDPTNIRRKPKIRNPANYFNLVSGGSIDPDVTVLQKVSHAELLKDYSLLEKDISAAHHVKDISFCTGVILRSLFVRTKDRAMNNEVKFQFILFDGKEVSIIKLRP